MTRIKATDNNSAGSRLEPAELFLLKRADVFKKCAYICSDLKCYLKMNPSSECNP